MATHKVTSRPTGQKVTNLFPRTTGPFGAGALGPAASRALRAAVVPSSAVVRGFGRLDTSSALGGSSGPLKMVDWGRGVTGPWRPPCLVTHFPIFLEGDWKNGVGGLPMVGILDVQRRVVAAARTWTAGSLPTS